MKKALLTIPIPAVQTLVSLQLLKLAWAAGFVDAEACIRIHKRKTKNGANAVYSLEVTISQNRLETLGHFREILGIKGSVYVYPIKRNVRRTVHGLTYRCTRARQVLELLLPYLVRKKEEALLGIEFAKHASCARLGRRRHSLEEIYLREDYFQRMKALK